MEEASIFVPKTAISDGVSLAPVQGFDFEWAREVILNELAEGGLSGRQPTNLLKPIEQLNTRTTGDNDGVRLPLLPRPFLRLGAHPFEFSRQTQNGVRELVATARPDMLH
jgi:hypothetical protein